MMKLNHLIAYLVITVALFLFTPYFACAELGPKAKIIFAHHSMGAILLGSRTWTKPRKFAKPEDMHACIRLEELNKENLTNVRFYHHDRDMWNSLRDCRNEFVEPSWDDDVMGKDGNTPEHWQKLFVENRWPAIRDKMLTYDVIVIKNSYQTIQDDHSPDYKKDPEGAYTVIEKMEEWKQDLRDLAQYFREKHPDKILVHLGPAPRRGLSTEGKGIHFPTKEVADAGRAFAQWMADEWVCLAPNIRFFYWFDYLADENNVMDKRWRYSGSHYAPWRGKEIGIIFAEFIYDIAVFKNKKFCGQ